MVKYQRDLTVAIGQSHTVELPPRVLRVRLTGLLFETDKTFLLPSAMKGIRGLVDLYEKHPNMAVVVTGHTDRVGSDAYNLGLSDERAKSIAHYLKDEVDGWMKWYQDQPYSAAWGVREDQHMLSAILDDAGQPFYRGPAHGQLDAQTRDAIKRFQKSRGLSDDGNPGPQTRKALVTDYMKLDGTTLPASADVKLLGCGENHNEVPTADGVEEQQNRRAEIFLFDPPPADPAVPAKCPGSGCPYEEWKKRTAETYDFDHDLCELWVECRHEVDGPIKDAQVRLERDGSVARQGPTDGDGRIQFKNLMAGKFTVIGEKEGYSRAEQEVEVHPLGAKSAPDSNKKSFDKPEKGNFGSFGPYVVLSMDKTDIIIQITGEVPEGSAPPGLFDVVHEGIANEKRQAWERVSTMTRFEKGDASYNSYAMVDSTGKVVISVKKISKNLGTEITEGILRGVDCRNGSREPLIYTMRDHDDPMKKLKDPPIKTGETRKVKVSARARVSIVAYGTPFPKATADFSSMTVDPAFPKELKSSGFDDVSLVDTMCADEKNWTFNGLSQRLDENGKLMTKKGKVNGKLQDVPLMEANCDVLATNVIWTNRYRFVSTPTGGKLSDIPAKERAELMEKWRQDFTHAIVDACHAEGVQVLLGYVVGNDPTATGASKTSIDNFCNGFAGWLRKLTPAQIDAHAQAVADFVIKYNADGVQFDIEVESTMHKDQHRDAFTRLYHAVSDKLADRNGIVAYANGPFTSRKGDNELIMGNEAMGGTEAQWFPIAREGHNVITRPMCYGDVPFPYSQIEPSVTYSVGRPDSETGAALDPSQIQFIIDAIRSEQGGIPRAAKFCKEFLRPNRIGICIHKSDGTIATITRLKAINDALNPDEAPLNTPGQPIQVPIKDPHWRLSED